MTREQILYNLADLRCLFVLPKRYNAPKGKPLSYWTEVSIDRNLFVFPIAVLSDSPNRMLFIINPVSREIRGVFFDNH